MRPAVDLLGLPGHDGCTPQESNNHDDHARSVGGCAQGPVVLKPSERSQDRLPVMPLNLAAGEASEKHELQCLAVTS